MAFTQEHLDAIYTKTNGYCRYCEKKLAFSNYGRRGLRGAWEVDHSVPVSRGGTDYLRNLVPACMDCNNLKGARTGKSFAASMRREAAEADPWGPILLGAGLLALAVLFGRGSRPASQGWR